MTVLEGNNTDAVISPELARTYYELGSNRPRIPALLRRNWGSNMKDTQDARGARAALNVISTYRAPYDEAGARLPEDLSAIRAHMDLGMSAIENAGILPLSVQFTEGYERMAEFVSTTPDEQAHIDPYLSEPY